MQIFHGPLTFAGIDQRIIVCFFAEANSAYSVVLLLLLLLNIVCQIGHIVTTAIVGKSIINITCGLVKAYIIISIVLEFIQIISHMLLSIFIIHVQVIIVVVARHGASFRMVKILGLVILKIGDNVSIIGFQNIRRFFFDHLIIHLPVLIQHQFLYFKIDPT